MESSEIIMLDRLFVEDETTVLKFDKEVVEQGMSKFEKSYLTFEC